MNTTKTNIALILMVSIVVIFILVMAFALNLLPSVNNMFQLAYAQITKQFISADQIQFFTLAAYPINNQVSTQGYNAILNGTAPPQLLNSQYYIANTGINVFPLTTPTALTDFIPDYQYVAYCQNNPANCTFYNYIPNIDTVAYANCKSCFPQNNSLTSQAILYVYPLYVVQYSANCSSLIGYAGQKLIDEIEAQTATAEFVSSPVQYCGNPSNPTGNFVFQALVGATPNYSTAIDGAFMLNNPNYQVGSSNFMQTVSQLNVSIMSQSIKSVNNAPPAQASTITTNGITATSNGIDAVTLNTSITSNYYLTNVSLYEDGGRLNFTNITAIGNTTSYNFTYTYPIIVSGDYNFTLIAYDNSTSYVNDTLVLSGIVSQATNVYPMAGTPLNDSINGTILGYVTFSNDYRASCQYQQSIGNTGSACMNNGYLMNLPNASGVDTPIPPIPNLWSGSYAQGNPQTMLDSQYCWNSMYSGLTNQLQTDGYAEYPYLYQYQYQNATYLCLTVAATNSMLNATSNIDGSNLTFTPNLNITGNVFTSFPDYLIVNQTAVENTYEYLSQGGIQPLQTPVLNNNEYWFLPNQTEVFIPQPAPNYEFNVIMLNQYAVSTELPLFSQLPAYTPIAIDTYFNGQNVAQAGVIVNASTYFYGGLLQNLTYQYQFTQPQNGTPVYCSGMCDYNSSLVYSDYGWKYEYASPDYGYVELPQLNQTVYYTPQFSIVSLTPMINDTNPNSQHYGQYCFYSGNPYTCQYGLSPSQMFDSGTQNAFIMYAPNNEGTNNNTKWIIDGQTLSNWYDMEGYLNSTTQLNKIVTIERLNSVTGAPEWTVTGTLEQEFEPFIIIQPSTFNLDVTAYPEAHALTYNLLYVVVFFAMILLIPAYAYIVIASALKQLERK